MKNIFLITLSLLIISCSEQKTHIPDDGFEQALIDLGYDSGPLDDYVLTANINNIIRLDITKKNCSNNNAVVIFNNCTHAYWINRNSGENMRSVGHEDKAVKRVLEQHIQNITGYMKQAKNQNSYESIIVVAEPGLIGPLVSSLEKNNLPISQKVNKQLTQITEEDLSKRMCDAVNASFAMV